MNEFGEPNMGNPSVRFDEGRERVGHWPCAFQSILSRLLYIVTIGHLGQVWQAICLGCVLLEFDTGSA